MRQARKAIAWYSLPVMPVAVIPGNGEAIGSVSHQDSSIVPKRPRKRSNPLTVMEAQFVELLVAGVDQVTAAKRAGYSDKHIAVAAWKLAHRPKIVAAVSARAQAAAEANAIDATYVVDRIKEEIEYLRRNQERSAAASQAIFRGTELLGKTIALFRDRVEEDRQITVTIQRVG